MIIGTLAILAKRGMDERNIHPDVQRNIPDLKSRGFIFDCESLLLTHEGHSTLNIARRIIHSMRIAGISGVDARSWKRSEKWVVEQLIAEKAIAVLQNDRHVLQELIDPPNFLFEVRALA